MLRKYLVEYQSINNCGKVTIDNIRRSLSTFFSWLEEEDYIIKSPMTGIRVGELVRLNIEDIDFSERECVVYGKGDKERKAYFDAKTKLHLMNYIEQGQIIIKRYLYH